MLKGLHRVDRSAGDPGCLLQGQIGNEAQVQNLPLFIGQRRQDRRRLACQRLERVGFDIATGWVVDPTETLRLHSATALAVFIYNFVPGNREQQRNETVFVTGELIDPPKDRNKDVVRYAVGIVGTLRGGESYDLTRETIPQPLEPWCLPEARRSNGPPKRRIP